MTVTAPERLRPSLQPADVDAAFARIVDELTRRRLLAGGLGAASLLGLAGCDSAASTASSPSPTARAVRHKYGTTQVPPQPDRVVTLGYTDEEPVLALGVRPVGIVQFFGADLDASWPWEKQLWNGASPQIIGDRDTYHFEKIAALEPDLIIGLYSGMTARDYTTLSAIAPTVAQPSGYADFAAPWDVITRMAGQALGREKQADDLVKRVQAQFADARAAHPQWAGRTVAIAEPFEAHQWAVFGAGDPKLQFAEGLGFTVAPEVRAFNPGGDVKNLSVERLDLLDVDCLILLVDTGDRTKAQVMADPVFRKLPVSRGRTLFLPFSQSPPVGAALAYNSVLSIPYGITHAVEGLAGLSGLATS